MFYKINKWYDNINDFYRFLIFLFGMLLPVVILCNFYPIFGIAYIVLLFSIRFPYLLSKT